VKNSLRIIIPVLLAAALVGMAGCSSSISQEDYEALQSELQAKSAAAAALESQVDELNADYQELELQYNARDVEIQAVRADLAALNVSCEQLMQQDEARLEEIQDWIAEYDALVQDYNELKAQYDSIVDEHGEFTEAEVDQAIFALVNQDRRANGLDELEWGVNLYGWARQNSISMSDTGEFKYTAWLTRQAVLITAGQATLDGLVNGVMMVWRQQKHEYTPKFMDPKSPYGAVATYKLGGVYYVTFAAALDP